jgi:hypothetical protein
MAPLFLFLASSFNVELVYVILKSITQFSYIGREDCYTNEKIRAKLENLNLLEEDGDMTLHLKQIKIKDFDKW